MKYHNYIFFDVEQSIYKVSKQTLTKYKILFIQALAKSGDVSIHTYTTLGLNLGSRFMVHLAADDVLTSQRFLQELMHTSLGKYLRITYTLLGMTRPSQYKHATAEETSVSNTPHTFLIIYPFVKTIEWYLLPFEDRKRMMGAHVAVGRKFSASITQMLLYAFGIDDHEFIVSYQTNDLSDFQTLVMELRETEARRYTQRDTPIFTCIHGLPSQVLESI